MTNRGLNKGINSMKQIQMTNTHTDTHVSVL